MLMLCADGGWGICIPPPARVRGDPSPWVKSGRSYVGCVRPEPPILSGGIPAEGSQDWWTAERKLAVKFVLMIGGNLSPPVQVSSLRIAHPHNDRQVEALRAVYNGDVSEPEGGSLPRVWRWEHEDQVWWLVELPPELAWAWRNLL